MLINPSLRPALRMKSTESRPTFNLAIMSCGPPRGARCPLASARVAVMLLMVVPACARGAPVRYASRGGGLGDCASFCGGCGDRLYQCWDGLVCECGVDQRRSRPGFDDTLCHERDGEGLLRGRQARMPARR